MSAHNSTHRVENEKHTDTNGGTFHTCLKLKYTKIYTDIHTIQMEMHFTLVYNDIFSRV